MVVTSPVHSPVHGPVQSPESRFCTNPSRSLAGQGLARETNSLVSQPLRKKRRGWLARLWPACETTRSLYSSLCNLKVQGSPRRPLNRMATLFDLCVHVILHSPSLSRKAALYLPQKISLCILFEACQNKNFAAVEKLVESWSHPALSFEFFSIPFCRQRRQSSKSCLLTPEYFNVYSSVEFAPCITSIAIGLFKNVQRQTSERKFCHRHLPLKEVDMSHICPSAIDDG